MPNRYTQIPDGPVPSLGKVASCMVPLADLCMILMLSRPATGSLRHTWVTPATYWLAWTTAILGLALGIDLLITGSSFWAILVLVLSIGFLAIAVIGADQRRRARR